MAYGGDSSCYGTNGIPSGFYTLLGMADGSFQPATFTPLGLALYQVKLINFGGVASNLDIAALDQNFNTQVMSVFVVPNKADGSGSFNLAKATKPISNYIVSDIVARDYNSDGKQDLTLLTEGQYDITTSNIIPNSSGVLLLPGNGDYNFGTPALVNPTDTIGILPGYDTTVGYDLATGLGSVNAFNLVEGWTGADLAITVQ